MVSEIVYTDLQSLSAAADKNISQPHQEFSKDWTWGFPQANQKHPLWFNPLLH